MRQSNAKIRNKSAMVWGGLWIIEKMG
jgi:hypothetical protein